MHQKIAIIAFGFLFGLVAGAEWGYDADNGPDTWATNYTICDDNRQSPIDIVTASVTTDNDLPIVDRAIFYSPPTMMSLSNNGHTLVMTFDEGAYTITDSNLLPFNATIAQYHFHWGSASMSGDTITATGGSEHTKDGRQYFGELHAVHYNTKYNSISEAVDKSDGLAVFGWFIDITYPQTNQDIKNFLDIATAYAQLKDAEHNVQMTFSLETLLPPNLDVYYRYRGSLTTPPCFESVLWTVFDDPIEITPMQALILSENFYATTTNTTLLVNNFRPPQPLNGRAVTKPPALIRDTGSGTTVRPSVLLALLGSALAYYI